MEEINIIVVCLSAFAAVLLLLSLLAGLIRLLSIFMPARVPNPPQLPPQKPIVNTISKTKSDISSISEREQTALITAVLMSLEKKENRTNISDSDSASLSNGWKFTGRIEGLRNSFLFRGWRSSS